MASSSHGVQQTAGGLLGHLSACIASVDGACQSLEATNASLYEHTADFARLATVLRSKRHFDLISESDIRRAREHLQAEIAPQLKELILRAEQALQADERRAKALKSKVAQHNARLEQLAQLHHVDVESVRAQGKSMGAGKERKEEGVSSRSSAPSMIQPDRAEVQALRDKAASLQQKRRAMQSEMATMERKMASSSSSRG